MTWTDLSVSSGDVLTNEELNQLDANLDALADGDAGAPDVHAQRALKTATASTAGSVDDGSAVTISLSPYSFFPMVHVGYSDGSGRVNMLTISSIDGPDDPGFRFLPANVDATYDVDHRYVDTASGSQNFFDLSWSDAEFLTAVKLSRLDASFDGLAAGASGAAKFRRSTLTTATASTAGTWPSGDQRENVTLNAYALFPMVHRSNSGNPRTLSGHASDGGSPDNPRFAFYAILADGGETWDVDHRYLTSDAAASESWTDLSWSFGEKVPASKINQTQANLTALAEGASGAPRIARAALRTATASTSGTLSPSSAGDFEFANIGLNAWSFFPAVQGENVSPDGPGIAIDGHSIDGTGADSPRFGLINQSTTESLSYVVEHRYITD